MFGFLQLAPYNGANDTDLLLTLAANGDTPDSRAAKFTDSSAARDFKELHALVEKNPSQMYKIAIYPKKN